jgi:hypothetical protein
MTALVYASGWDGRAFTRWPVRPAPPCAVCGQPGSPYLRGPRCDRHRPRAAAIAIRPVRRPTSATEHALDRARRQHPGARSCAAVDRAGRPTCPYPLDPANGDEAWHMACEPGFARVLADVRAHNVRRQSAAARAAVAAATGGAA